MTVSTNQSGIACCGNCGKELEVTCTGGCPEPDAVLRENYIATMKKPSGGQIGKRSLQKRTPIPRPGTCVACDEPVVPYSGRGRVPIRCIAHMPKSRAKAKP